jgi:hypothetical protein
MNFWGHARDVLIKGQLKSVLHICWPLKFGTLGCLIAETMKREYHIE